MEQTSAGQIYFTHALRRENSPIISRVDSFLCTKHANVSVMNHFLICLFIISLKHQKVRNSCSTWNNINCSLSKGSFWPLLLSPSLKPPYVFHPFSLPVILQMLCLAVQLYTYPLQNLCSSNFFLSFPVGYQMEKKINHYCLKAYYTHWAKLHFNTSCRFKFLPVF